MAATKRASRTVAARLHRLSGQLDGVERMLRECRSCNDVLTQLRAIQAGLEQVSGIIIRDEVRRTARSASARERARLESLISELSPL